MGFTFLPRAEGTTQSDQGSIAFSVTAPLLGGAINSFGVLALAYSRRRLFVPQQKDCECARAND